jgi:hypothetical protein
LNQRPDQKGIKTVHDVADDVRARRVVVFGQSVYLGKGVV